VQTRVQKDSAEGNYLSRRQNRYHCLVLG